MRKTLPYGRLFRTEESSARKSLPYGRAFCTEEPSVRKTLPYASSVRKARLYGTAFHAEGLSVSYSVHKSEGLNFLIVNFLIGSWGVSLLALSLSIHILQFFDISY